MRQFQLLLQSPPSQPEFCRMVQLEQVSSEGGKSQTNLASGCMMSVSPLFGEKWMVMISFGNDPGNRTTNDGTDYSVIIVG